MAPSCIVGHPQRSLVRIPGSGFDKNLKPVCLEIAQITSFQMEDIIPRNLLPPPEVPGTRTYNIFESRNPPQDSGIREQTNTDTSFEDRNIGSPTNSVESSPAASPSRPSTPESDTESRKRPIDESSSPPSKKTNVRTDETEVHIKRIKDLLEKREDLKQDNKELESKLKKFKELLKDRVKLNEFLNAMKELKC